jgi:hypothetical protein
MPSQLTWLSVAHTQVLLQCSLHASVLGVTQQEPMNSSWLGQHGEQAL